MPRVLEKQRVAAAALSATWITPVGCMVKRVGPCGHSHYPCRVSPPDCSKQLFSLQYGDEWVQRGRDVRRELGNQAVEEGTVVGGDQADICTEPHCVLDGVEAIDNEPRTYLLCIRALPGTRSGELGNRVTRVHFRRRRQIVQRCQRPTDVIRVGFLVGLVVSARAW